MSETTHTTARNYFVQRGYRALREHQFAEGDREVHIAVIGPYQAGKSTFINTLFNARYPVALTGHPEDDHREGVTQKIHVYGFNGRLHVYDTPGFWDASLENQTRVFLGLEQNGDYVAFDNYALCKTGTELCPVADRSLRSRASGVGENVKWVAEAVREGDGFGDWRARRKFGKLEHIHTASFEDRKGVVLTIEECRSLGKKGDRIVERGRACSKLEERSTRPALTLLFVVVDIGDRVANQQISSAKAIAREVKERFGTPTLFLLNRGLNYQRLSAAQRARAEHRAVDTMRGEFPAFMLSAKSSGDPERLEPDHEEVIATIAEIAFPEDGRRFRHELQRDFHDGRIAELDRELINRSVQAAHLPKRRGSGFLPHLAESVERILSRSQATFAAEEDRTEAIEKALRAAGLFAPDGDIWSHTEPPASPGEPSAYAFGDLWPRSLLESEGSFAKMGRALRPQAGYPGFLANLALSVWVYNQVVRAERAALANHAPGEPRTPIALDTSGAAELRAIAEKLAGVFGVLATVMGAGTLGKKTAEVMPIYEGTGLLGKFGEAFESA
ncbi:MAG: 50S ribosome-binding GTPase [Myxococcales bacterium]|nr:50S ribosome-binding GTPase [Myxococcales bacterium]